MNILRLQRQSGADVRPSSVARPSLPRIIVGWVCAGIAFPFVLNYLYPGLAGLTVLYLLTGALMILVAPLGQILLARRAVEVGLYSPPRTVAKVAAGILSAVLLLALLGVFNFA